MTAPETLRLSCGPVQAIDLALFAAASGDHNPLHLDEAVAQAAGFERPLVHGMYTMACVGRLFTQAFGAGSVLTLQTRFTGTAMRGDELRLDATLQTSDGSVAEYALTGQTGRGTPLVTGVARVALT